MSQSHGLEAQAHKLETLDQLEWPRVLQGDTAAFENVVGRYQRRVSAVAISCLRDFAAAQDVAQETFLVAWRDCQRLTDVNRLGAWLCGIARNLARDWMRRESRTRSDADESLAARAVYVDPAESMISAEEQSVVRESLEAIPEMYREALVLFYHEDQSVRDVAQSLEISEDTARQRLSRGRAMLRDRVAEVVEGALRKSRPGKVFTASVMAGLVSSVSASTAAASGAATVASTVAAAASPLAVSAGTIAGLAGGAVGAAGGLAGAWIGSWVPQQLAPTMTERELMRKAGRRSMIVGVSYTLALILLTLCFLLPNGWIAYVIGALLATACFVVDVVRTAMRTNRELQQIREHVRPEDDPNPSQLRARLLHPDGRSRWIGRRFTSSHRLLGIPLLDVQFGDPLSSGPDRSQAARAFGWIALGDRADGILFAFGGRVRGLIAFGGMAMGGVAIGGLSLGVLSIGGLAAGVFSFGGLAMGYSAAGGGAMAWHDAAAGGAIAWHAAFGGLAIANEYAVGGVALADAANTDAANSVVAATLSRRVMDWQMAHRALFIGIVIAISVLPTMLLPMMYKKVE